MPPPCSSAGTSVIYFLSFGAADHTGVGVNIRGQVFIVTGNGNKQNLGHSQNASAFHLSSFQDDTSFLGNKACPFKHSNMPLKIFSTNLIGADCIYHAITR